MKGVTIGNLIKQNLDIYFNSHAREGRDDMGGMAIEKNKISTHTPVKGVTLALAWTC